MTTENGDSLPVFLDLTTSNYVSTPASTISAGAGGLPFWGDNPKAWDTVVLGGYRLPGIAKIKGKVARRHEKKNVSGKHGSSFAFTGDSPTEISIVVTLWTAEHLDQYAAIMRFLRTLKPHTKTVTIAPSKNANTAQAGGFSTSYGEAAAVSYQGDLKDAIPPATPVTQRVTKVFPVRIVHPAASVFGVSQVLVTGFSFLEARSPEGSGVYEATIDCIEYIEEQFRNNGGVTAPQKTTPPPISSLGTGAIAKAPTSPATTNTAVGF